MMCRRLWSWQWGRREADGRTSSVNAGFSPVGFPKVDISRRLGLSATLPVVQTGQGSHSISSVVVGCRLLAGGGMKSRAHTLPVYHMIRVPLGRPATYVIRGSLYVFGEAASPPTPQENIPRRTPSRAQAHFSQAFLLRQVQILLTHCRQSNWHAPK